MAADWLELERLAEDAAAGDREAWAHFMERFDAQLHVLVRRQRIGRLRSRDDDVRDIALRVYERLAAADFRSLRRYFAMPDAPSFRGWIGFVVRSCAIDHLRQHPEFDRSSNDDDRWLSLATLRTGDGRLSSDTLAERRRRVLLDLRDARARAATEPAARLAARWGVQPLHVRRLVERGELYEKVLVALFEGHRYSEIAQGLGLTRREVELAVLYVQEFMTSYYSPAR